MFDREGKRTEANAAYEKAVDLGTTSACAYHRAAVLNWRGGAEPDQATLARMQKNPPAHRESDHDRSVRAVAPADRGARAVETQHSLARARSGRRLSGLRSTTRTRGKEAEHLLSSLPAEGSTAAVTATAASCSPLQRLQRRREDSRRNCLADPANQHICPVQRICRMTTAADLFMARQPEGAYPTTLSQRGKWIDVLVVPAAHAQPPGRSGPR